ncbi:phage portal protein [Scandinavium goeteborgense]|uniref:phage portal protein n=1 Tax=Scandinavium goeteborgense TaxID=1851514 RepID=UPI00216691CC|nr:phage portal protein [Scandinavium goeteborgense]MCS2152381.1 phage portal protein [Scandinavium goeteborgense]
MKEELLAPDGITPLRQYAGYQGAGVGFGGQLIDWSAPQQSADAALLPTFYRGNARADDLVRNNPLASNIVELHKDHIVGNLFKLSYRPNYRHLGISREEARALARDIEAAWSEYAEDPHCMLDIERKRTFTMMIREGVATHAFNGEVCVQPAWDTSPGSLFRTRFKMVSPKRIKNPGNAPDTNERRAGVEVNKHGAAVAYWIADDNYPSWGESKARRIPARLSNGRVAFIHVFEPMEDGQTRGDNVFYSIMERLKMLDTLQQTQLQSVIVKAMYAATIRSPLDSEKAFEFLAGGQVGANNPLVNMMNTIKEYYEGANIKLGGVKIPHLMLGDELDLQTAQSADSGFTPLESSIMRNIAAGAGVSYEELSRDYSQTSYSSARASANISWRYYMGRRRFIASRQASLMFGCWFEEAIARGVIKLPSSARYSFYEARNSWTNALWIGAGRMAIDGLKEAQESAMRITTGQSTFQDELALQGKDYEEVFEQQEFEIQRRRGLGLTDPDWAVREPSQTDDKPGGKNAVA